jgi:hypothetical protein
MAFKDQDNTRKEKKTESLSNALNAKLKMLQALFH